MAKLYDENDMFILLKNIRNNEHIIIVETTHFLERTDRRYCSYKLTYQY